jgi:transcription elongation GreA/GreB family factor
MKRFDKRALIAELRAQIAADLAAAVRVAKDAAQAATHEEAKPENDKDMRSTEASYLARGQVERVRELERSDNALQFMTVRDFKDGDAIDLGAVAICDNEGARVAYFVSPTGGGMKAKVGDLEVLVVTPQSPVGHALAGKSAGDTAKIRVRGALREIEIVEVV